MRHILTAILFLNFYSAIGQPLDSLWQVFNTQIKTDTNKVLTAFEISNYYYNSNPDTTIYLCKIAESISVELNYTNGLSESYGWLGFLYQRKGLTPIALEYFIKSWKIREELGDKSGIANALNNIGYIYDSQKQYELALEHYNKALEIRAVLRDSFGIANILNNIAYIYDVTNNKTKGLSTYQKSLEIRTAIGDIRGQAESLHNLAAVYRDLKQYNRAQSSFKTSMQLALKAGDKHSYLNSKYQHAEMLQLNEKSDSARILLEESLKEAKFLGFMTIISECNRHLYSICKRQGDYKKALQYFENRISIRDSLTSQSNQKAIIKQQTVYEFDKQRLIEEQAAKEQQRIETEELERRNNLQYSLILLGIVALFTLILSLGKVKFSNTVAEGLIFFSFLLLFEFLLILTEPIIEPYTGGEPLYKLTINAVLAAAIFPLHAFFEKLLKKRLLE